VRLWTKEQIEVRAELLIRDLLLIYPLPKALIDTQEKEIKSFSLAQRDSVTLTNTKPNAIDLFEREYQVKSWRDLYIKTVEIIYTKYEELFDKHIELNSFNTNKNFLSLNKEDIGHLSHFQIGNFYLNTNLSSTQTLSNIATLFEVLEIDEDVLSIHLVE